MVFALAIAAGLQLFDRRAGQDQRVGTDDVIDIGTDGGQRVDTDEVGRSHCEAFVHRVTVDEERAVTEFELAELAGERLGLRSEEHTSELQSLMRLSYAVFCLKKTNTH